MSSGLLQFKIKRQKKKCVTEKLRYKLGGVEFDKRECLKRQKGSNEKMPSSCIMGNVGEM